MADRHGAGIKPGFPAQPDHLCLMLQVAGRPLAAVQDPALPLGDPIASLLQAKHRRSGHAHAGPGVGDGLKPMDPFTTNAEVVGSHGGVLSNPLSLSLSTLGFEVGDLTPTTLFFSSRRGAADGAANIGEEADAGGDSGEDREGGHDASVSERSGAGTLPGTRLMASPSGAASATRG